jgi:hypothetical protein
MDSTHQYYQQFADEFFASTVGVDMAAIRERFISKLKPHAHILDVGCGFSISYVSHSGMFRPTLFPSRAASRSTWLLRDEPGCRPL